MKLSLLGEFSTESGNLVASDPCYVEIKKGDNVAFKVKPGTYDCYAVTGTLKDPLFQWDEIPGNFRNAEVWIINQDHKDPLEFKKKGNCGVDSGTCGFFKAENYRKDALEERPLKHELYSTLLDFVQSGKAEILSAKKALDMESEYGQNRWERLKKIYKNNLKEYLDHTKNEIKFKTEHLKENQKYLAKGTCPRYLEKYIDKKTKEFYELMIDLVRGPSRADVDPEYGVNSSSGIGDGGYDLYVAKNKDGDIVAAYLSFLNLKELKD